MARIYGKELNRWTEQDENGRTRMVQVELAYKDLDANGNVVATGSEDFSAERLKAQTEKRWVYTWDGTRLNKGGKRWFDCRGLYTYRKEDRKAVKALMVNKYEAHAIELR